MFTSIFNNSIPMLSISNAVLCIGVSLLLGLIISLTYIYCSNYSKNLAVSLVLLPILIQVVILMVNGNLGTGIAVLGAFSLIRFRSIPGNSKEISYIFFAMAIGLALGTGYLTFASLITVVVCIIFIILSKSRFGEQRAVYKHLRITIPEDLNYDEVFDDLFDKYTKSHDLERVKTTNLGSMYELSYEIILKNNKYEKEFMDELRCRNGNLTIICSKRQINQDEL